MMKDKKVLLIAWFFYPKLGGAELIVLNQARFLRDLGYKVAVLTSPVKNLPNNDEFENIKIFRRNYIDSSNAYKSDAINGDLEKICSNFLPQIIHFHNGSYPSASTDMIAGAQNVKSIYGFFRNKNCFIVEHSHNAQLKDPVATKQLRDLDWDTVICVSNFVKEKWQEFGNAAKNLTVVYNGIDLKKFDNVTPAENIYKLRSGAKSIIFFPARVVSMTQGGISKQKNFELLIKSCYKLLKSGKDNFLLVAILNQSEKDKNTDEAYRKLDELLEAYDLGSNIKFIPTILPDDMPNEYAAADIICVPSLYETFGLVYLEAMASGKVAIASNTGGPKEYIKNGETGFLVDPKDETNLVAVLDKLITDKKMLETIGNKAKISAENYSVEKMMNRVLAVYKKLTEEK